MKENWSDLCYKDKASYIVAFTMIASGMLIAFLSFFLNEHNIETGVLIYIAQCFVVGGSLVGASVYFKSKFVEFNTNMKDEIAKKMKELEQQKLEQ